MPAIGAEDVVVGMSASGEFRDVIAAFEQLRGKCTLVGITHVPGSSISKLADHLLVSSWRSEPRPGHDQNLRLHPDRPAPAATGDILRRSGLLR